MTIGQLARATGEPVKTLRFWADAGLLEAERGANRYRYFPDGARRRVRTIRQIQGLGFSLAAIVDIIALRERGLEPCQEVRERLQRRLNAVRAKLADLQRLETELAERLSWASTHPDEACDDPDVVCVILDPERADAAAATASRGSQA